MTVRRFSPDPDGLAALRVEADAHTVVPLTNAIAADARRFVPVLTGDLRSSIRTEVDGSTGYVIAGDEDVDYAAYQEFGTTKMVAQPYLRPAAYMARDL